MRYESYAPGPALANYIKCYWSLQSDDMIAGARERIFPDGCVELVFHTADLFVKYKPEGGVEFQPRSFIHGQLTRFIEIGASGRTGIFSVRFKPAGLKPFIDFAADEIRGENIHIIDIWGAAGRELEERILLANNDGQRIILLENFLLSRLKKTKMNKYEIVNVCVNRIEEMDGTINIEALAADFFTGKRHLERKFMQSVGLSLKQLARITRFQHVLGLIERKEYGNLTSLAYKGGFYDQAHFIKDFKEFTGLNPREYFSTHLPLARYLIGE